MAFPQHLDPAHETMPYVPPEPLLETHRPALERGFPAVHLQQHGRGEVPHQVVYLGVERQAARVEYVDREPVAAAPCREHLREDSAEEDGRRDPGPRRPPVQSRPGLRPNLAVPPDE